jgi:hypothetical protein
MRTGRFCFLFLLALLAVLMMDSHFHSTRGQTTYLCPDGTTNCYQTNYAHLTDLQRQGRDTWYFWTGGDRDPSGANIVGDQALWRHIAVETHGQFDLVQAIDSRYRGERFKRFGVISDPDCKKGFGSGCVWSLGGRLFKRQYSVTG